MSHACYRFWKCYKTLTFRSLLTRCTIPCACHAKRHLNIQKCSEPPQSFSLLTSKCASRHNGVHFFDISASKSGPKLKCLVHFDFEMCFAPQRGAFFRHRNFEKCSEREVFYLFQWQMCFALQRLALFRHGNFKKCSERDVVLPFSLANVLCATTACIFSTSQLPKVVRAWCVLYILTWKCASGHNGVHFFISHLARWLRTRRFSEPNFCSSGATDHWKNTVFRDFPTFSRISIFFLLTLSLLSSSLFYSTLLFSLTLPISAFHLSIVGSLTSKLPSIIYVYIYTYNNKDNNNNKIRIIIIVIIII